MMATSERGETGRHAKRAVSKDPTGSGLYWLMLDDGGCYRPAHPVLVRVTVLPTREVQVEGMEGFDFSFEAPNLAAVASGTIRRVTLGKQYGIIGSGWGPNDVAEVRITWLGAITVPPAPPAPTWHD